MGHIFEYREKILTVIFRDLHSDYSKDAILQDYGHQCQDLYRDAVAVRRQVLTGIVLEGKSWLKKAKPRRRPLKDGAADERLAKFKEQDGSQQQKAEEEEDLPDPPPALMAPPEDCLRNIIIELKEALHEAEGGRAHRAEVQICHEEIARLSEFLQEQNKALNALEREINYFGKLWNRRVVFYRSLQRLSDDVVLPESLLDHSDSFNEKLEYEGVLMERLRNEEARQRYLQNLNISEDNVNPSDETEDHANICQICRGSLAQSINVAVTDCGHMFCKECLITWFRVKMKCPTCNCSLTWGAVHIVDPQMNQNESTHRNTKLKLKEKPSWIFPAPSKLPKTHGSYSTKVTMILKHIKYLTMKEPDFKCLVFSQWEEMLSIMARAFDSNDIEYVRFGTQSTDSKQRSEAPSRFKNDPNIKVFMLNARSQCAGLTLVSATHIFFVEPSLHPGVEWQAMGRVHRLGQQRETFVHRYLVLDTVEHDIYQLCQKERMSINRESLGEALSGEEDFSTPVAMNRLGESVKNTDLIDILYKDARRSRLWEGLPEKFVDDGPSLNLLMETEPDERAVASSSRKREQPEDAESAVASSSNTQSVEPTAGRKKSKPSKRSPGTISMNQ